LNCNDKTKHHRHMEMDYEDLLMKVLECFLSSEGTIYNEWWEDYGITSQEADTILKKFDEHRARQN